MTRHRIDPLSLVFGLLYSGIGIVFVAKRNVSFHGLTWLAAVIPLAIGVAVIANAIVRLNRAK